MKGTEQGREELLDQGEQHFYDGDYDKALAKFDEAIALDDEDAESHYLRGRALFYLQRDEEAEAAYDRALDLEPAFAPALVHKAELFVRACGWPEEALQLLDEADDLDLSKDDRIEASFVRGLALLETGDYRHALEPLNRAVRGDSTWAEALRERGICRFYLWRFEDAERDLRRAVERDPSDADARYYLAMVEERLGRESEAAGHYEKAAELDPAQFHPPYRVSREEFDRIAAEAFSELPEEFRLRFENVSFGVQDLPLQQPDVLPDVQGLFVGQALTERSDDHGAGMSSFHPMLMPCQVLLFKRNIERISKDEATLKDEIGKTVLHEVGHYFGLNEEDMVRLSIH